ncbi:hypothetical protein V3C99_001307, partial [Haemonchus contortus]
MDIVFAINTEGMSKTAFDNVMGAISQFADDVDLAPDVARFGLIYGNKEIVVPLTLGGYQEKEHMKEQMRRVSFMEDSSSDGVSIYDPVKQQFSMFPRKDSSKIAIVVGRQLKRLPEDADGIAYLFITPEKLKDGRTKQVALEKMQGRTFTQIIARHCSQTPTPIPQISHITVQEQPKTTTESKLLSKTTDESGNIIYPITKPDGSPLPTDTSGNYVTDEGAIIEKDRSGRPLGPDGQVLPTDDSGYYIYPAVGPDGSPLPTDMHKRPIYPIVGEDGSPLPTDRSGAYISPDGRPIPTDSSGKPLGEDGAPLPTDASGHYVIA